jgi:hypothetical protein
MGTNQHRPGRCGGNNESRSHSARSNRDRSQALAARSAETFQINTNAVHVTGAEHLQQCPRYDTTSSDHLSRSVICGPAGPWNWRNVQSANPGRSNLNFT